MKDRAMERVLEGLGKVEAPSGLEGRVLRRLVAVGDRRRTSRGWVLGLGFVTAMILSAVWIARWGFATPPQTMKLSEMRHPEGRGRGFGTPPQTMRLSEMGHPEIAWTTGERSPGADAAVMGRVERAKAEAPGYLEAGAKAEGLESFPAPPEPLTEQERLLVRVARHPRAGEEEFLIAEVREAALLKSEAEFDLFFPAPLPLASTEDSQPGEEKEKNNEVQPIVR